MNHTAPVLTTETLMAEYAAWGESNRNAQDLRFGQAMEAHYRLVPQGAFFIENKHEAFEYLQKALADYQR